MRTKWRDHRSSKSSITIQGLAFVTVLSVAAPVALTTPLDKSGPTVVTPPPGPPSPSGLAGSVDSSGTMNLTWTALTGASYVIDRETVATGAWATNFATSTTAFYHDTSNLGNGYHYRVSAVNSAGTSAPSAEYPVSRYAVIDLGTNAAPYSIANNGMMLGWDWNTGYQARWVQGTWQDLTVPGAQSFGVTFMNNNGAVVGTASFPLPANVANFPTLPGCPANYFSEDTRGVLWGASAANPAVQATSTPLTFQTTINVYDPSSNTFPALTSAETASNRTYTICTDGMAGTDYAAGTIYGSQAFQFYYYCPGFAGPTQETQHDAINNDWTMVLFSVVGTGDLSPLPNSGNIWTVFGTEGQDGFAFSSSGSPTELGNPNYLGDFNGDWDSSGTSTPSGYYFTGTCENVVLANANGLVSTEVFFGPDIQSNWPTNYDYTFDYRYFPASATATAPLPQGGGTLVPAAMKNLVGMTHATNAADDMIIGNDNGQIHYNLNQPFSNENSIPTLQGYYWNITSTNSAVSLGTNNYPNAINTRYYTPTGVPDYQILGNERMASGSTTNFPSVLWERTRDTNGAPANPPVYTSTVVNDLVAPGSGWNGVSAPGINDGGAIVGTATYSGTNTAIASGSHGIMLIPDSIQRDGMPINSTNNTVCIGQQINLTNMISGVPTNAITYWSWSIPGAEGNTNTDTAIYDYEPTALNSNYTNLVTPTNYLTNSSGRPFCNFYWTAPGTNQVSCTTVIYGQTNTVSATLNVVGPSNVSITATNQSPIQVSTSYIYDYNTNTTPWTPISGAPYLSMGQNNSGQYGIVLSQTNSSPPGFSGSTEWVQLINYYFITNTTTSATYPHSNTNALDTAYPDEDVNPDGSAYDAPAVPLRTDSTNISTAFSATTYLMWQPDQTNAAVNGDNTLWVPLRSYTWGWTGAATNSTPTNVATWGLSSSNYLATTATNVSATNEPTWTINYTNNWNPPFGP